jgi:hypothetical protein
MALRNQLSRERDFQGKRRGVRVNSRVPVAMEWEGDGGKTIRQEAHTRIVNPYGCLVVLPHNLELGQRVRLTNLANSQSNPAVVVWKGNERAEGRELGLKLVAPGMDFWGLEL